MSLSYQAEPWGPVLQLSEAVEGALKLESTLCGWCGKAPQAFLEED